MGIGSAPPLPGPDFLYIGKGCGKRLLGAQARIHKQERRQGNTARRLGQLTDF